MQSETKENRPPKTTTVTPKHGAATPAGDPLPCPRCESRETKFCYYNNYNLAQPRYFCKGCRRYWTLGGTLRNVPVGGGSRKNSSKRPRTTKRPPPSSPNSASSSSSVTALTHEAEGPVKLEGLANPEAADGMHVTPGGFGYGGYGLGMYDAGVGFQPLFGSPAMGYFNLLGGHGSGGAVCPNTWQFLDDLGCEGGVGDSLAWPGLAISTPGDGSSK